MLAIGTPESLVTEIFWPHTLSSWWTPATDGVAHFRGFTGSSKQNLKGPSRGEHPGGAWSKREGSSYRIIPDTLRNNLKNSVFVPPAITTRGTIKETTIIDVVHDSICSPDLVWTGKSAE